MTEIRFYSAKCKFPFQMFRSVLFAGFALKYFKMSNELNKSNKSNRWASVKNCWIFFKSKASFVCILSAYGVYHPIINTLLRQWFIAFFLSDNHFHPLSGPGGQPICSKRSDWDGFKSHHSWFIWKFDLVETKVKFYFQDSIYNIYNTFWMYLRKKIQCSFNPVVLVVCQLEFIVLLLMRYTYNVNMHSFVLKIKL